MGFLCCFLSCRGIVFVNGLLSLGFAGRGVGGEKGRGSSPGRNGDWIVPGRLRGEAGRRSEEHGGVVREGGGGGCHSDRWRHVSAEAACITFT